MSLKNLDNLVKIGKLKTELPDQKEFEGMVSSAKRRLQDAHVDSLSEEGRFSLAYGAAHALALAAMRWHGYRSDNRYLVFQCLEHTVGLTKGKWQVLAQCHDKRNKAEYEGMLDVSPQLLKELTSITSELLSLVDKLGAIQD